MIPILAAILLSQCATGITDNAQELCGLKTLPEGAVVGYNGGDYPGMTVRGSGVYLDGPYAYVQSAGSLFFRDFGAAGNLGFIFDTGNVKTNEVVRWYNHATLIHMMDRYGNMDVYGTLTDKSGVSSHVSLTSEPGYLVTVQGRAGEQQKRYRTECFDGGSNPDGGSICYWPFAALHGSVDLNDSVGLQAGFVTCIHNPLKPIGTPQYPTAPGAESLCFDYLGGITPIGPLNLSQFGTMTWEAAMSPDSTWTYGQYEGTLMYAHDTAHWYVQGPPDAGYTQSNRPTTGAWRQIALTEEWLARVISLEARLADAGL